MRAAGRRMVTARNPGTLLPIHEQLCSLLILAGESGLGQQRAGLQTDQLSRANTPVGSHHLCPWALSRTPLTCFRRLCWDLVQLLTQEANLQPFSCWG